MQKGFYTLLFFVLIWGTLAGEEQIIINNRDELNKYYKEAAALYKKYTKPGESYQTDEGQKELQRSLKLEAAIKEYLKNNQQDNIYIYDLYSKDYGFLFYCIGFGIGLDFPRCTFEDKLYCTLLEKVIKAQNTDNEKKQISAGMIDYCTGSDYTVKLYEYVQSLPGNLDRFQPRFENFEKNLKVHRMLVQDIRTLFQDDNKTKWTVEGFQLRAIHKAKMKELEEKLKKEYTTSLDDEREEGVDEVKLKNRWIMRQVEKYEKRISQNFGTPQALVCFLSGQKEDSLNGNSDNKNPSDNYLQGQIHTFHGFPVKEFFRLTDELGCKMERGEDLEDLFINKWDWDIVLKDEEGKIRFILFTLSYWPSQNDQNVYVEIMEVIYKDRLAVDYRIAKLFYSLSPNLKALMDKNLYSILSKPKEETKAPEANK